MFGLARLKPALKTRSSAAERGRWGEDQAVRWLRAAGYRILGRRVRPDRRDEIDVVARQSNTLVFVEVKTRSDERFGRPAAAVDRRKRAVQSRAAVRYLRRLGWPPVNLRFDVIEVIGSPEVASPPVIRHVENAFPLDRRYMLP